MTPRRQEDLWRDRFIAINLVRIGGTIVVLVGLYISQTDAVREGGAMIPGLGLAIARPGRQLRRPEMAGPQMADPARSMKRFYKAGDRPSRRSGRLRHPARRAAGHDAGARKLADLPAGALADAVAAEWNAQGEKIDPRSMPLTGLANAAIDRVAPGSGGLRPHRSLSMARATCSAIAPKDPSRWSAARPRPGIRCWLGAAALRCRFRGRDRGIVHRAQPGRRSSGSARAVAARDPFALAALSPLVTIAGSLIIALALAEGAIDLDAGLGGRDARRGLAGRAMGRGRARRRRARGAAARVRSRLALPEPALTRPSAQPARPARLARPSPLQPLDLFRAGTSAPRQARAGEHQRPSRRRRHRSQ